MSVDYSVHALQLQPSLKFCSKVLSTLKLKWVTIKPTTIQFLQFLGDFVIVEFQSKSGQNLLF